MDELKSKARRRFLMNMAAAGAMVPLMRVGTAYAGLPHLKESDANAKALHYHENVSEIDPAKQPTYKKGRHCGDCMFFKGGTAKWGGCAMFPGKDVHIDGWCMSWTAKPA